MPQTDFNENIETSDPEEKGRETKKAWSYWQSIEQSIIQNYLFLYSMKHSKRWP